MAGATVMPEGILPSDECNGIFQQLSDWRYKIDVILCWAKEVRI